MTNNRVLVIFTRDLRVNDNPALSYAASNFDEVFPLFVIDEKYFENITYSNNRRAYLYECLNDLKNTLQKLGSDLIIKKGDWHSEVTDFVNKNKITYVTWAKDVSEINQVRDKELSAHLRKMKIGFHQTNSHFAVAPGVITPQNKNSEYKVFTPYYNKWREQPFHSIESKITSLPKLEKYFPSKNIGVVPKLTNAQKKSCSANRQIGGETLIRKHLNKWIKNGLEKYDLLRDFPRYENSNLSSALHFGTISANEIVFKLKKMPKSDPFLRQICWRDFYGQILFFNPQSSYKNYLDKKYGWNDDEEAFDKWCYGKTGYPIVDAAMKQLMHEGYMHNRCRMIVASFLTKDLFIDWQKGAWWFSQWLTDADAANNSLGWQWVAGTGTDTNPHRIFNPIRQSERFDEHGEYIKKYLPELKDVPEKYIHFPCEMNQSLFESTDSLDYPLPMIDHKIAIEFYKQQIS
ncbi:MAG: deoxyribodipyrimidine photo-lyase [Acidimicrobiia bacterium]